MASINEQQRAEVVWYRRNGRWPDQRIKLDSGGEPYVIGDKSWNSRGTGGLMLESIEAYMPQVPVRRMPEAGEQT